MLGPTYIPTPTLTLTPTLTPTPTPTSTVTSTVTPSPTPTPLGGSGKLLVSGAVRKGDSYQQSIYQYDISTQQISPFLEGYQLECVSPDGTKLLISRIVESRTWDSKAELFLTNSDGTNPVLISDRYRPANSIGYKGAGWLEGTNLILFRVSDGKATNFFSYAPTGEIEQITTSGVGVGDFSPVLVDGGFFWEESWQNYSYGWRWSKLDDKETKTVGENWINPEFSPDGRYAVYKDENLLIMISKSDGSDQKRINIEDLIVDASSEDFVYPSNFNNNYIWFPDSSRLLLLVRIDNSESANERLFILSKEGELVDEIDLEGFIANDISLNWMFEQGSWSPDGLQLLFINRVYKEGRISSSTSYIWNSEINQLLEIPINFSGNYSELFWFTNLQ
jgi:hypothetical protein